MIISKQKTRKECIDCGKEIFIRNDYFKTHKGRCQKCAKIFDWKKPEYAKKCSDSHIGKRFNMLPYGESNFNNLFHNYTKSAIDRGISFELSRDQFRILTKQNCAYCGVEPLQIHAGTVKTFNGFWIHNGVDRKNDDMGYTIENAVPCCKVCNYAKQGLTDIEFLQHVKKIYQHNYRKDKF